MTTKPSDMKPRPRMLNAARHAANTINDLAKSTGTARSVEFALANLVAVALDEQHAAGHRESEPVLAPDEAAWADYRARSAPVAEPPAQPVAAAPAYRVDIALLRQAAERCRDAKPDGHELLDALRHLQGCFGWQTVLGLLAQLGAAESKLDAIEGAACVAAEPAVLVAGETPTGAALLWKMFGNRMSDERYCHMLNGAEARSIVDERAKLAHERYEALLQVEKLTKDKESLWKELEGSLKQTLDQKLKHAGEIGEVRAALTASNERAERLETERPHLLEGCRLMLASHELGLVRDTAYGAALDRWIYAERARLATDPPTPATGGEGEA